MLVVVVAAAFAAGCHDQPPTDSPERPVRLPRDAKLDARIDGPAFLATARAFRDRRTPSTNDWQLGIAPIPGASEAFTYRVPFEWEIDPRGRAANDTETVKVNVALTPISDEDSSMADYLIQLAAGAPFAVRTTANRWTVYSVERTVSVAPSDPDVPERRFHTLVVDIGDRIAKFDITYDAALAWRFDDLAHAILGTVDLQQRR
jgi:hypothetical protein